MLRYVVRRILLMSVALVVICTTTFFLMHFLPGSPFNDEKLSNDARAQLEAKYGLDEPLIVQYARYMSNLARGDFGNSFYFEGRPVLEILLTRLPISAFLGVQAILFGVIIGLLLGVVAALRHNSVWDSLAMVLAVLGISVPSFVLGPLLQYWVGVRLGWLPIAFFESWAHSVLPSLALAVFVIATVARFTRAEMLEVMGQDYIALARSKGLSTLVVIVRHVLRNSLIPLITVLFPLTVFLVTGSLVVEQIFAIPGIGEQFIRAIAVSDYFMIMGTTIFFSLLFMLMLLLQDIIYGLLDPRMRIFGERE
jgi:oligopeptide transport system permease protein